MTTKQKYSKGDKAFIAPNVRPTYIQGVEVEILGFRRGRYDVKIADDPRARRYSGIQTRCEEDWLVEKPGQSAPKEAKQVPTKKFKAGDAVMIKERIRPSYLPGTVVQIIADRRGKYDVQLPEDPSLRRFSGIETRVNYDAVEETDEEFAQPDGMVKVWATLVPEKGVITHKSPGDIYELFGTKAQAEREARDRVHSLEVKQVELPPILSVIVYGSTDWLEEWYPTDHARDTALAERDSDRCRADEWTVQRVIAAEKKARDEQAAEMRAEGMMS